MKDEQVLLIALVPRTMNKLGYQPYPNSIIVDCPKCGQDCWMGPKQREQADTNKFECYCYDCIVKMVNNVPDLELSVIPLMSQKEEAEARRKKIEQSN